MSLITRHNYEAFLLDYSEGNLAAGMVQELEAFAAENPDLAIELDAGELPSVNIEAVKADFKHELKKDQTADEELLNYLEGDLSAFNRESFEKKLAADNELREQLAMYQKTLLVPGPAMDMPEFKAALKKSEDQLLLNNRALLYVEDQLTPVERKELEVDLEHSPGLKKEVDQFKNTRLIADLSIGYPGKASLRKKSRLVLLINRRVTTAMAAALLLLAALSLVVNYYTTGESQNHTPTANAPAVPPMGAGNSILPSDPSPSAALKGAGLAEQVKKRVIKSAPRKPGTQHAANKTFSPGLIAAERQVTKNPALAETVTPDTATLVVSIQGPSSVMETAAEQATTFLEEVDDQDEDQGLQKTKKGFWHRAVAVARQANSLGLRSIDGEIKEESNFRLSFHAFSVEKK